jgi:hypothetical protein
MIFEIYIIIILIICGILFIIKQIKNEINTRILKLKNNYFNILKNKNLSDYEFNKILNKIKHIDNYLYN